MGYITSSVIYYIVFLLAGVFFAAADRTNNSKKIRKYIAIGIFILCFFAGMRGTSVGTDTATVVHFRFDNATLYKSWKSLLKPGNEPFVSLIAYFIKKSINNYHVFLFILELLCEIPLGIIAYKLRNRIKISGFMTVFMLMFYQISLNIHKQSIAAAWLLLAVMYFREKKIGKAALVALFSTLFHGSVFMGIGLFTIVYILSTSKSVRTRMTVAAITGVIAFILFLNWKTVSTLILGLEQLSNDYTGYIAIAAGERGIRYTSFHYRTYISLVLRSICFFAISRSYLHSEKRFDVDTKFYMYCTFVGFLIYSVFIVFFNMYIGDRLTLYLDISQIILVSLLIGKKDMSYYRNRGKFTLRIPISGPAICLSFYMIYNFMYFMVVNYGKTLPYIIR